MLIIYSVINRLHGTLVRGKPLSFNSDVLGRITAEQRIFDKKEQTATWHYRLGVTPTRNQFQAMVNTGNTIGGLTVTGRSNVVTFTLPATTPDAESAIIMGVIDRFIKVIDRGDRQQRETPLAENSTVPVHGHHYQD